ncbi:alpha-mannosidase [Neobacillus kokaensis]|uniref:Alpha-mannosidase n=1 Tax=Neobacillus kokaensis TaxID=2759023 RepID=A0ABQ3MZX4_9BACI|nr:alpha-mannosidase [Neobacillus kokaensis]GHH97869.1 alpha-mannosidase [Neobacillus kokaensis]
MQKIQRLIQYLQQHQMLQTIQITDWTAVRCFYSEPLKYDYTSEEIVLINEGDWLIDSGKTMFLEKEVSLPAEWRRRPFGLTFLVGAKGRPTNHEGLVFLDDRAYHGIDRNRSYVPFPEDIRAKEKINIKIELFNPAAQALDGLNYQNEPAEFDPPPLELFKGSLALPNTAVQSLLTTVKCYHEAARLLPGDSMEKYKIIEALTEVYHEIHFEKLQALTNASWVAEIEETLKEKLSSLAETKQGQMLMVGQSHIDLAWLWPVKEAVRKCSRTFSTMSTLLDENPNFTYAQSQPQAYAFVKEYYPEIYQRVTKHIADGRWEVVGGMWVEPDLNMPSGESLVRQLLYGMKFYKEEFAQRPRIEWLPDTFGYCASLPQLLKKAGLDYFMTTKMNWNDTNPFPYDLFYWEGIDGTRILSYLNHGLNEYTHPKEIENHWSSFKQKKEYPKQMLLYGHGDGGGGVTQEMIDYVDRSASLPGLPAVVNSTAHEFFDGIRKENPKLPTWVGDMYLELHRGTYTTHARNKKWNRKAEVLYREAEIWSTIAANFAGASPAASLEEGWKLLLLNQFHDIIPGSSIPEVYVKSESDYREIFNYGEQVKLKALNIVEKQINTEGDGLPVLIFNSLSWTRSETVNFIGGHQLRGMGAVNQDGEVLSSEINILDNGQVELSVHVPCIPEMGYTIVWLKDLRKQVCEKITDSRREWETEFYLLEWNEKGEISRLYDKKAKRDVLSYGAAGNQFQLFHDRPLLWDAWDIDPGFEEQPAERVVLLEQVIQKGETKDVIHFKWELGASVIEQDMILSHHSKRIDFQTKVDWQEQHKLLKVAFPVDVVSNKATFEIPFGSVERATHTNTSWEKAQFEVCGHRFADLSETGYGVSLLNDCKYGYDVKQNILRLSLLRAPKWPDPGADLGDHEFTYSLLPHEGDWREAEVVKRGYELNHPVVVVSSSSHKGNLPGSHSFIETKSKHVILDTVKTSEDGTGITLRMYESGGGREEMQLKLVKPVHSANETNLLEEKQAVLTVQGNKLSSSLKPFEVKTILVTI